MSDEPKLTQEIVTSIAERCFSTSGKEFIMAAESLGHNPLQALCMVVVTKLNALLAERRLTLKEAEDLLSLFMVNQVVVGYDAHQYFHDEKDHNEPH